MPDQESERYANFPFIKDASKFIREKGPSLDAVLNNPEYARIRAKGLERVMDALEKGEICKKPTVSAADCLIQIISYPVARIIVSAVNDSYLTKRYSLAEAERAHSIMENEAKDTVMMIAAELGMDTKETPHDVDGNIQLYFPDYLKYATAIRGAEWKLVNQRLKNGYVQIPRGRFIRLIQQAIQYKIESELPLKIEKVIRDVFKNEIKSIKANVDAHRKTYRTDDVGKISVINLPPCIRKLLSMAQGGENVPHQGRFALTTFLHTLGMTADDIIKVFAVSPDFDPSKSRYQVEHITGIISGTEYSPPECRTMKTYGICFSPDDLCKLEWMTHPLKYYRTKTGRRSRDTNKNRPSPQDSKKNGEEIPTEGNDKSKKE